MKRSYTIQALLILLFGPLGLLYTSIILSIVFTLFFGLVLVAVANEPSVDFGKLFLFTQAICQFFGLLMVYGRNKDLQTKEKKDQEVLQTLTDERIKTALAEALRQSLQKK